MLTPTDRTNFPMGSIRVIERRARVVDRRRASAERSDPVCMALGPAPRHGSRLCRLLGASAVHGGIAPSHVAIRRRRHDWIHANTKPNLPQLYAYVAHGE